MTETERTMKEALKEAEIHGPVYTKRIVAMLRATIEGLRRCESVTLIATSALAETERIAGE